MMKIVKKILRIIDKKQKKQCIGLLLIMFIGALLELAGVSLIMPLISAVTDVSIITENKYGMIVCNTFGLSDAREIITFFAFAIIIVYILKNAYLVFMYRCQYRFTYENNAIMSKRLFKDFLNKTYSFHKMNNSADIIRCVTSDVDQVYIVIMNVMTMISELMVVTLLVLYLGVTNILITGIVVIVLIIAYSINYFILRKKNRFYGEEKQKYSSERIKVITESLGSIKELKILCREKMFVKHFEEVSYDYARCQEKFNTMTQMTKYIIEAITICGVLLAIIVQINVGGNISYLIPQLAVFAMAAFRILPSANRINGALSWINFCSFSMDAVNENLELVENADDEINSEEIVDIGADDKIEIKNLDYKYDDGEDYILKDVNFEIKMNTSTAFIGPSGAGKTTMSDLILGLLTPTKGGVYVNGKDVSEHRTEWNKHIGYIPQSIYLTDDTIRHNVALGINDEDIDNNKVIDALKAAQLYDFVSKLPQGMDTVVGETGSKVSGGQKQRIGIARALYNNPEILVMDEATSALDNDTEKALMDTINNLHGKKTLIIIAHRLSTIASCDYIYEIKDAQVVRKESI